MSQRRGAGRGQPRMGGREETTGSFPTDASLACVTRRATLGVALGSSLGLSACGAPPVEGMATLDDARRAVAGLANGWRTARGWALPQVLMHLAQSIEFSMSGFPQSRSAAFQATLGRAAFAWFDARGRMSHGLTEPIPGAPALEPAPALEAAQARLDAALSAFGSFPGALKPHFAYGHLDKTGYTRAHLMHLANHWTLFVRS